MYDRKIIKEVNVLAEYGVPNYWTYLVGAIFIVLVSGSNTLSVLRNSVSSGIKGDYLTACSILTGDTVLIFLAQTGVTTSIETTPVLLDITRYLGTSYLLYLGNRILYTALKSKNNGARFDEPRCGAVFRRMLILSLTNPEAILFYVLFFIQFIDVGASHTGASLFVLAAALELVSFCYLSLLIISGVLITQYIYIRRKPAKVSGSLIDLMFVDFTVRLAALQS